MVSSHARASPPRKPLEKLEGAQTRLLGHVLGVALVADQPAREIIGRIEMRQDGLIESWRRSVHKEWREDGSSK